MRTYAPLAGLAIAALVGCARHDNAGWQGYLEGEFVYVASPLPGRLDTLSVQRGARVQTGDRLFALESDSEAAARREAAAQLRAAESRLADLRKGSRPTEIAALEARLKQARAASELSRIEFARQQELYRDQAAAKSDYDRARSARDQNARAVDELNAQLATARLGGRSDAIAAAESETQSARAALAKADWSLQQKSQAAPAAGLVYDTLYRAGEFVAAGNPVVVLLPPANLKVRFFVSEADFGALKAGDTVSVSVAGHPALSARISYLSPQPEFTPPVLYNRDNRSKLVFMVEAVFSAADARDLHPGQPVDVTRGPPAR